MKHLLSIQDLSTGEIQQLLDNANNLLANKANMIDQGKTAALLFYEPSTRTKMSFEMACMKSGVNILSFMPETSSVTKGETLYDTVKTVEAIGVDFVVIRHEQEHYYDELTDIQIPIINAGDGTGEHPTQSLLDLLTIKQEFGQFEGLNIAICGDILHSRVARSNANVLSRLGANVQFVAKDEWRDERLPYQYVELDDAVEQADVLMLLRVQKERHNKSYEFDDYLSQYGLTVERERRMKPNSIIMHPAPINRGTEIDSRLVECDRSRIFKQMRNGVAIRQAIIQVYLNQGGYSYDIAY
ncbi:aspartate carbamoyltransferase catalytic subunit [Tenuibacillus multivorans]|uniref:Aspartate carbamoyltransferase n=1 Tax=Tenuibacillus multivorans TaxID=237069 RepID=A0A1G9Y4J8_9BACI|nr:aspartate carbamoyltransferase catalytic subunit [Tenuibacillus multivorans]GEL75946.1 aspartate carbamoyltransferase [Tenuibacillus multivorans]SDN03957.1 aspartate carbamoyltransferase catalytic subunit [Tenuibacillus multivorans]